MIEKRRCASCNGSKSVMGSGMIHKECEECEGKGHINFVPDEIDYLSNKETHAYQSMKSEIKALDPNMTEGEAEALLESSLEKEVKKRGRPKVI